MPDWSYHPFLRPLGRIAGPRNARAAALHAMGAIAMPPGGPRFIEGFGDLEPPAGLRATIAGVELASRVGLAASLDLRLNATRALGALGTGYVEVGPFDDGAIASRRLQRLRGRTVPLIAHVRVRGEAGEIDAVSAMAAFAAFVVLDAVSANGTIELNKTLVADLVVRLRETLPATPLILGLGIESACGALPDNLDLARAAIAAGAIGVALEQSSSAADDKHLNDLRRKLGDGVLILVSADIDDPRDALALFDAGATLVSIGEGLIRNGPGLPRRINDALASRLPVIESGNRRYSRPFWAAVYGIALGVMGIIVLLVGATRVMLPYDERYLHLTRAQLGEHVPRLLPFMLHDRVTAGGTALATGTLFAALAIGMHRGERWAWRALAVPSSVGFATYWLWLRLGYFEPLHTLATIVLLPLVLAIAATAMRNDPRHAIDRDDAAWRNALIAQLLLVVCAIGFIIGGFTIASVGVTSVFVQSDLAFLRSTPGALDAVNRHLIPVIAHDRSGFGGSLVTYGIVLLLVAMWGFRRATPWLWWGLVASSVPLFVPTLAAHFAIGYDDFMHLAPVYFAALLFVAALALSRNYLTRT